MIDWELRPLVGCGPLDFGAPPAEVNRLLGPPRFDRHYSPTDYRQSRGKGVAGYDVILGFNPNALLGGIFPSQPNEITILNHRVFHTDPDDLLAILKQINGGFYAIYHSDFFAFAHLGIVLCDWMNLDSSDRWIGACSVDGYITLTGKDDPDEIVR